METSVLSPEMATPLLEPNAAQRGTHIRRRNRKRFDGAVAIVRSGAGAGRHHAGKVASQRFVFDGIVCTWSSEITFPLMRGVLPEIRCEHP
jgi:hypothetical protein